MALERLRRAARVGYDLATPSTAPRAALTLLVLFVLLMFLSTWALGLFAGASDAIEGDPVDEDIREVEGVETEIWTDMAEGKSSVRVLYGLFHWIVAVAIWFGVAGLKLGHAHPQVARILEWPVRVLPYAIVLLGGLQVAKIIEMAVWRRARKEPLSGGEDP